MPRITRCLTVALCSAGGFGQPTSRIAKSPLISSRRRRPVHREDQRSRSLTEQIQMALGACMSSVTIATTMALVVAVSQGAGPSLFRPAIAVAHHQRRHLPPRITLLYLFLPEWSKAFLLISQSAQARVTIPGPFILPAAIDKPIYRAIPLSMDPNHFRSH